MSVWQLLSLLRQQQTLKVCKSEVSRGRDHNTNKSAALSQLSAEVFSGMIFVIKDAWKKKRKLHCSSNKYIHLCFWPSFSEI